MTGSLESSYWQDINARSDAEGVAQFGEMLSDRFGRLDQPVRIQSLGSGCCAHDINLSRNLRCNHVITCSEINTQLFEQARGISMHDGLHFEFREADLEFIEIGPGDDDVIVAHASLHHGINLELRLTRICRRLTEMASFS